MFQSKCDGSVTKLEVYSNGNTNTIPVNVPVKKGDYLAIDPSVLTVNTYRKHKGHYIPIKHRGVKG
jgi:hypothetical protein